MLSTFGKTACALTNVPSKRDRLCGLSDCGNCHNQITLNVSKGRRVEKQHEWFFVKIWRKRNAPSSARTVAVVVEQLGGALLWASMWAFISVKAWYSGTTDGKLYCSDDPKGEI